MYVYKMRVENVGSGEELGKKIFILLFMAIQ